LIYPGSELDLFSHASNWKAYWAKFLTPFIHGHVLEVGAGIGSSTLALSTCSYTSWTCLEPDPELAMQLSDMLKKGRVSGQYKVIDGSLEEITVREYYDTILYIDVLEHIKDDLVEIQNATQLLSDVGTLIILGPAHQWLFSEFDNAIGHYRRYNKRTLMQLIPKELNLIKIRYLDSVGLFASLANRTIMHKSMPSKDQIEIWDRIMVPYSRIIDPLLLFKMGKSVLGIWQRRANKI